MVAAWTATVAAWTATVAAWTATVAGTTILQNSQLTASVFGLVEREGAAWRVAAARAGAARGAAWQPAGLEVLPVPIPVPQP